MNITVSSTICLPKKTQIIDKKVSKTSKLLMSRTEANLNFNVLYLCLLDLLLRVKKMPWLLTIRPETVNVLIHIFNLNQNTPRPGTPWQPMYNANHK